MTDAHDAPLRVGKLPPELLAQLLEQAKVNDPSVILGPRMGEDAALIDTGGENYLVVSSDPITFAVEQLGWYAVHVNANDIAASGGTPRWMTLTAILPEGAPPHVAQDIMRQTLDACAEIGVTLVGGHTEVTHGLDRPIAIGTMIGEVQKGKETPTSGVREGDAIVLTRGMGIEGAAVLAIEMSDRLRAAGVSDETLKTAANLLYNPGISVVKDAATVANLLVPNPDWPLHEALGPAISAMHDPTEGGVATALHEMADASGVGIQVDTYLLEVFMYSVTEEICRALDINPLGLIAGGALLIAVRWDLIEAFAPLLERHGVQALIIGRAVPRSQGVNVPRFERDELARILG